MSSEKQAILDAYAEVIANLTLCRDKWLADVDANPADWDGVTKDAMFWCFIESM